jgi:hypothetical protein
MMSGASSVAQQTAQLVDDRGLDVGRGYAPRGARLGSMSVECSQTA